MASSWRSLPLLTTNGYQQMAIDRWLLDQHIQGKIPSILRFYTWEPIALSLGYHQRQFPDHWQNLTWQGQPIELVQRPTGGRGVLHQGDLTYAIITSGLSPNRRASYQQICEFLIQGFRRLDLHLTYGTAGRGYIHNPNCFGSATAADLVLPDGSKLIGSAQLHKDGAILQHGSIRLNPNQSLFDRVFGIPESLPQLSLTPAQVIPALTQAAQQSFGGNWYSEPLSEVEWGKIAPNH